MCYTGKSGGPSIEEYIKWIKSKYPITWKINPSYRLMDNARIWWESYGLSYEEMKTFLDDEYEKLFLDK
jgi:hypothetical protein